MYRLTKKAIAQRQKLEAMRIGRERARMEKDGKRLTIHLNPALVGVTP